MDLKLQRVDNVLVVKLNRPEVRNALNKNLLHALMEQVEQIKQDPKLNSVIFTSSTDEVFCAGADLKERIGMNEDETMSFVRLIQSSFNAIAQIKIPTIAAINGNAFGGGLELALACDIRIGCKDSLLGLTECSLGIIPGAGGTQRLPQIVGKAKALELILSAQKISGEEAFRIGLLNRCLEKSSSVMDEAIKLGQEIAQNAPLAVVAAKKAIQFANLEAALAYELSCYEEILKTKDRLEGLHAFKEKRQAQFCGK